MVFTAMNLPFSQRFATRQVNQILKQSNVPIHIDAIRKIMPGSVKVQGVVIADLHGDTIIYAGNLQADIRLLALLRSKVKLLDMDLDRAVVDIARTSSEQKLNIAAIFQSGGEKKLAPTENEPSSWEISIHKGALSHIAFRMSDSATGLHMSYDVSELALKGFRISLLERDIRCKSLDLNGTEGIMNLTPRLMPKKENASSPWNLGLLELWMKDVDFSLQQAADSLNLEAHIGEGSMLAREMDFLSKTINLRSFSLEKTSVILGSKPTEIYQDIDLNIKDFRFDTAYIGMKVRKMSLDMGNGFSLKKVKGELDSNMDQTQLQLEIETGNSRIELKGAAEEGIMDIIKRPEEITGASLELGQARISLKDLFYFDSDLEKSPFFASLSSSPIELEAILRFEESLFTISDLRVSQKNNCKIALKGSIDKPFQIKDSKGEMDLEISGIDHSWLENLLAASGMNHSLPDMSDLHIQANISDSLTAPQVGVTIRSYLGDVDIAGSLDLQKERFKMGFFLNRVSLGEILSIPHMETFTGTGEINGESFSGEYLNAAFQMQIDTLGFKEYNYSQMLLHGSLKPGEYEFHMLANDSSLKGDMNVVLNLADSTYRVKATGNAMAQLHSLHLYDEALTVETGLEAHLRGRKNELESEILFNDLTFTSSRERALVEQLHASFRTDTMETWFHVDADFFNMDMQVSMPFNRLDSLGEDYKAYLASFNDPSYIIAADRVSGLPAISASGQLAYHSLLDVFLKDSGLYFSNLDFSVTHPPGINRLKANILGDGISYKMAKTGRLHAALTDSAGIINFDLSTDQTFLNAGHESSFNLSGYFTNRSTLTSFSVYDALGRDLYQLEVAGKVDSNQIVLEIPSREIILNREQWKMESADVLSIDLENLTLIPSFQMNRDSASMHISALHQDQDITYTLGLNQFELGSLLGPDLITGRPDGTFTGSIGFSTSKDNKREIATGLLIRDIRYFGQDISDIRLNGSFSMGSSDEYSIDLNAYMDSSSFQIKGHRNEQGDRAIDASFSHFPLISIQPFTKAYLSELGGFASGKFNVSALKGREQAQGELNFEDARLKVKLLNSSFRIPSQRIVLTNESVLFRNFTVLDTLNKALKVDGSVDFGKNREPMADLNITSSKLKLMSRDEGSNAPFSGNIYVDSRFSVKGPLANPVVEGKVLLSEGTEIFYHHKEDLRMAESENLVNFVSHGGTNGEITPSTLSKNSTFLNSSVETIVEIDPSTRINFSLDKRMFGVDLNVKGGGRVQYNMLENERITLSGSYEIGEGAALLKLLGWPNKSFIISQGGFIRWEGMVENPELNFEAENRVSSSYINPIDNKQREIEFKVILQMSGYLSDLNVVFTIRTPDQYVMSIINTMSPEEQMRQALQVLLFETIDLPGISSSTDYMTQQVNQILASQLNQLTKNTIKGVDISFGLDSYSQSSTGEGGESSTSLSYEVSKSLLNNRGQIEVSGRLNDVNQQPGVSDHSLNNVSFEYRLDSVATKYLKVYNEHSYDDVFEGEVTKTGIGFTYRKAYKTLSDIWKGKK